MTTKNETLAIIAENFARIAASDVAHKVNLKETLANQWAFAKERKITAGDFLKVAIVGGKKGGWTENRVRAVLRGIDTAFATRQRKKGEPKAVSFSEAQLAAIAAAGEENGLTSDQIESLLSKLA